VKPVTSAWLLVVGVLGVVGLSGCRSRPSSSAAGEHEAVVSAPAVSGAIAPDANEPGRHAINDALDRLYPKEHDFRSAVAAKPGEHEAPLAEVVAYRATKPVPHWHYVTYGLSELGAKTSKDPSLSGFGVEYTLRLVDDAKEPPVWPMNLLRWVATRVWETHQPFDPGHSANLPGGMLDTVSPDVEGLGFTTDADLGPLETPNGKVTFVNVVPLAHREWWLVGRWDFDRYLEAVRAAQGDLLWRVGRKSVLDGARGAELLARATREGSSQSIDFADLAWTERAITLDPVGREIMDKFLRYRLAFGRDATIVAGDRKATLAPGDWSMVCSAQTCTMHVPQAQAVALADALAAAPPGGVVTRPGGVRLEIDRTE
jgi:suppressor of fused-like protein